jgi:hypothetical protein
MAGEHFESAAEAPPRLDDPDKSFAQMAVEPPTPETNGTKKDEGVHNVKTNGHANGDASSSEPSTPPGPQLIEPHVIDPLKSYAEAAVEPPPSQSQSHLTNGFKHNGQPAKSPGEYEGSGILDAPPQSPTRSAFRKPRTRKSMSELKSKSASTTSLNSEDTLYESYHHNGQLTSIKPAEDYEENLALDGKEKSRTNGTTKKGEQKLQIASGRIAGEGWDKSGYVSLSLQVPHCIHTDRSGIESDGHR